MRSLIGVSTRGVRVFRVFHGSRRADLISPSFLRLAIARRMEGRAACCSRPPAACEPECGESSVSDMPPSCVYDTRPSAQGKSRLRHLAWLHLASTLFRSTNARFNLSVSRFLKSRQVRVLAAAAAAATAVAATAVGATAVAPTAVDATVDAAALLP